MRFLIASLTLVAVLCLGGIAMPVIALAQGQPAPASPAPAQGRLDVNINSHTSGGGIWWQSPVWIAIGVIALIVLVLIITMIGRGGGTTIVKD
jgi:hypothetical protein